MHIASDSDDVIVDFIGGVCGAVSRDFGVPVTSEDITSWDMGAVLDPILGEPWWEWMRRHAWLWGEKFTPVPGALGALEQLRRDGHWVEVITNKPDWAEAEVWKWYGRYKPPVQQVTVIPYTQDGVARPKHDVTDAVLLIDDRPEACADWVASRADRTAFLFSQPHNYSAPTSAAQRHLTGRVVRAADWHDVLRLVSVLEEEGAT